MAASDDAVRAWLASCVQRAVLRVAWSAAAASGLGAAVAAAAFVSSPQLRAPASLGRLYLASIVLLAAPAVAVAVGLLAAAISAGGYVSFIAIQAVPVALASSLGVGLASLALRSGPAGSAAAFASAFTAGFLSDSAPYYLVVGSALLVVAEIALLGAVPARGAAWWWR